MAALSGLTRALERLTTAVEGASALDAPADAVKKLTSLIPRGPVKDALSGTAAGHPAHPAVVLVPLGALGSAALLDVAGSDPQAVRLLTTTGLVGALPAVLTGWSDWNETNGAERRVGLVHAAGNAVGLGLVAGSLLVDSHAVRRSLSLAGLAVMGGAGWLGGHLSFALGVGVDTTAFLKPPTDWTDACAEADVRADKAMAVTVEGTPVLLVRRPRGIVAIGDRCTHRGAPLHEGDIEDGCVVCPWHGARFALDDGSLVQGPASRPASVFEVRVADGRVEVRRAEERALRLNPTT